MSKSYPRVISSGSWQFFVYWFQCLRINFDTDIDIDALILNWILALLIDNDHQKFAQYQEIFRNQCNTKSYILSMRLPDVFSGNEQICFLSLNINFDRFILEKIPLKYWLWMVDSLLSLSWHASMHQFNISSRTNEEFFHSAFALRKFSTYRPFCNRISIYRFLVWQPSIFRAIFGANSI